MKQGDTFKTKDGCVKVVEYINAFNVVVEFECGTQVKSRASNIRNGSVKNTRPDFPRIRGIGYVGQGMYSRKSHYEAYTRWCSMFERCYNEKHIQKHPSYQVCLVAPEWHNFQNFADWFYKNKPEYKNFHLDKDLLLKGNKIYSSTSCCFIPPEVNGLFVLRQRDRGDLPIGVCLSGGKYMAQLSKAGRQEILGYFDRAVDAFLAYKNAKEAWVATVAEKYREVLPQHVYQALLVYQVEYED